MEWEELPKRVDEMALLTAEPGWAIKRAASSVWTNDPVGYYWAPTLDIAALFGPKASIVELARCKAAVEKAGYECYPWPLDLRELTDKGGDWVKVAYSPTLRATGEALNFFPGQYPGGIPNHASPLAAMLTTALIGGGLGYGVGRIGEKLLPASYQRGKLSKTLGLAGALAGGATAAPWMAASVHEGKPITDPWPYSPADNIRPEAKAAYDAFEKRAAEALGDFAVPRDRTPLDVDLNAMGQTLWHLEASPQVAGSTMGTLYTASQLPDDNAQPGIVTVGQLGQLAMNAGKGYLTGALVGMALNQAIGMPWRHGANAGAALAAIQTVVPKLFGG